VPEASRVRRLLAILHDCHRTDCGNLRGRPFLFAFFKGNFATETADFWMDFAGDVEAIGAGVGSYKPAIASFECRPRDIARNADSLRVYEMQWLATIPQACPSRVGRRLRRLLLGTQCCATLARRGHRVPRYGASAPSARRRALATAAAPRSPLCAGLGTSTTPPPPVKSLGASARSDDPAGDFTLIDRLSIRGDAVGDYLFSAAHS